MSRVQTLPPNFLEVNNFKWPGNVSLKVGISKQPQEQVSNFNVFNFCRSFRHRFSKLLASDFFNFQKQIYMDRNQNL